MDLKKITLTKQAHNILKYVLMYTGEKEMGQQGQEIPSSRRLDGVESSQRRHYFKQVSPVLDKDAGALEKMRKDIEESFNEKRKALEKKHNKNPKTQDKPEKMNPMVMATINKELNDDKKLKELQDKFDKEMKKRNKQELEVELTEKTIHVIVKYFDLFGKESGWLPADDEIVGEVEKVLSEYRKEEEVKE